MRRTRTRRLERVNEFPPDLDRLRTVEIYLRRQLAAVRARIAELEAGRSGQGWALQLLPSPAGASPRGYLHSARCFISGRPLSRDQARRILEMPGVTACDACAPRNGLQ